MSEEMKHSLGPWRAEQRLSASENHKGWRLWSASGVIGEVYPLTEDGSPEARANAHLIAAAPDLYEAAKAALMVIEVFYNPSCGAANSLRAALARAHVAGKTPDGKGER